MTIKRESSDHRGAWDGPAPEAIPTAIRSAEFKIGDVTVRCHVLDNGMRVIDQESVLALLSSDLIVDDSRTMDDFVRWLKGIGG